MKIKTMTKNKKKFFLYIFLVALIFSFPFLKSYAFRVVDTTLTVTDSVFGLVAWAVPELRVGPVGANDDTNFYLTVKDPIVHDTIFTQSDLLATNNEGAYSTPIIFTGVNEGNYDVGFKSTAHLTKILRGVHLNSGDNTLNFTQTDNSPTKGSVRLVAGDINGLGTTPENSGDDVINSADLSLMIDYGDQEDLTGNSIRANLNQDDTVNAVDFSILLDNLDKEGDR